MTGLAIILVGVCVGLSILAAADIIASAVREARK